MVTPFTRAGEVDRASLQRLVQYLRQGGIEEYFVLGSTGESPLLDETDRLTIIETARAAAPEGLLYAGISGTGHRHAIRNAHDAARAGANVVVLMSPFFLSLDQAQLIAFCSAVADASPLPVTLYHHLRMPTPITAAAAGQLARHPNILGLKDTSGGDHDRCAEILTATAGRPFRFLQGVEKLVLRTLQTGGHGCVVAQACIAPQLFRGLFDAWTARDLARAVELQRQIDSLWSIFSRPEVKQSFYHFLHTLKLPLLDRGILANTAGALPALHFDPAFERMIRDFMQQHLEPPVLRSA
jgi:dihydrodipicolinate synthase/N-acetylneuraminate lyase